MKNWEGGDGAGRMRQSWKGIRFGRRGCSRSVGCSSCFASHFVTFGKLLTSLEQFSPLWEEGRQ